MKKIDFKKIDIAVLIIAPLMAMIISIILKANFLLSTLLFFGIPDIYLSVRNTQAIKKSLVFSILVGGVGSLVIDYFATTNGSWFIPDSIFSFRIFDIVPIDDLVWGFLLVFNIIMFYEHLLDKGKHNVKDTKLKYLVVLVIFTLLAFFSIYAFKPSLFEIDYFYIKAGIIIVFLPTISFLSIFPKLISKYVKTGAYFFAQGIIFELTALHLNQWEFNSSEYIGWIELNSLRFPIEELIFWMILFAICMLSYYEFFYDDRK